ncbi:hypothetical protein GCM10027259_59130 [Micromonospora palomenae]
MSQGMSDVINGLVYNAAHLLIKLSRSTGQPQEEILQEFGAMYADPNCGA